MDAAVERTGMYLQRVPDKDISIGDFTDICNT